MMKIVGIISLLVSMVSLGLIVWLLVSEPWGGVPSTIPQPTLTRCEELSEQVSSAQTEFTARLYWALWMENCKR